MDGWMDGWIYTVTVDHQCWQWTIQTKQFEHAPQQLHHQLTGPSMILLDWELLLILWQESSCISWSDQLEKPADTTGTGVYPPADRSLVHTITVAVKPKGCLTPSSGHVTQHMESIRLQHTRHMLAEILNSSVQLPSLITSLGTDKGNKIQTVFFSNMQHVCILRPGTQPEGWDMRDSVCMPRRKPYTTSD